MSPPCASAAPIQRRLMMRELPFSLPRPRVSGVGRGIGVLLVVVLAVALAALPLPAAALLVGFAIVGTLSLVDPLWAVCVAILTVPLQDHVALPGGLLYTQAALLIAAGAWLLHTLSRPTQALFQGRLTPVLLLLVWVLALASATTPYDQSEGFKETLRWSTVLLVYLVTLSRLRGGTALQDGRGLVLVGCLILATTAMAAVGLWQFATGDGPESFAIAGGRFVRAYGTTGQPNSFAGYLNMGWPLALALSAGLLINGVHRRSGALLLAVLACGGATLLLLAALGASFSRGGWVGALGGGMALLLALVPALHQQARRRVWYGLGLALAGVAVLLVLANVGLLPAALAGRLQSISHNLRLFDVRTVQITPANFAVVERMSHLQAGWDMLRSHPLLGVGPGNYTLAYEGHSAFQATPYALHPWYTSRGHAHNYYLHIAAEAGIAGLAAYLLLLVALVRQAIATMRHAQAWWARSIAAGCCGVIGAVLVHNLFENLHALNMGIQLAVVWALLEALGPQNRQNMLS
jgi:O-antigen ligase